MSDDECDVYMGIAEASVERFEMKPACFEWYICLARRMNRFRRARVIESYYDHPALAERYSSSRWTHLRIEVTKALGSSGMRDGSLDARATEVLLINGLSMVEPEQKLLWN